MAADDGIIIPFIPDTARMDAAIDTTIQKLIQSGEVSEETAAQFKASQAAMTTSATNTTTAATNLGTSFKDMAKNIAGEEMKAATGAVKGLGDTLVSTAEKHVTLRTQIRTMINALGEMRVAGKEGTEEFKRMQAQVAILDREMLISRGAVKNLAQEFAGLRVASEAIHGVNAAMQVGVGVSAMLADGNEKVEKEIKSMMAIMMVANGVQEAANVLKADSILRIKAEAAWETVRATALAGYGVVVGVVTGEITLAAAAQMAWNFAASLFPATAIVLGIGAIIEAIVLWINYNNKIEEQLKAMALTEKVHSESVVKSLENQMKVREAEKRQTFEIEKAKLEQQLLDLEFQSTIISQKRLAKKDLTEEESKEDAEYFNRKRDLNAALLVLQIKHTEELEKIEHEIEASHLASLKDTREKELEQLDLSRAEKLKLLEAKTKDTKLHDAAISAFAEESGRMEDEINNKWNIKEIKEQELFIQAKLAMVAKGSTEEFNLRKQLAQKQNQAVQIDINATPGQRAEAAAKLEKQIGDLVYEQKHQNFERLKAEDKKQLEIEIQAMQQRRLLTEAGSEEDVALLESINKKKQEIINIDHLVSEEELKVFLRQQEIEEQQYLGKIAEAHLRADKKAVDELRANRVEQLKIQKEFHKSQEQIDALFAEERKAHPGESDKEVYAAVALKLKTEKETEKAISKAAIDFSKDTADKIMQAEDNARNAKYEKEIAMIQKQAAFQLDNHRLSEAQRLSIQRKAEKEIAAIKLKQWHDDQTAKEEQAIINGALAVTAILAASPPAIGVVPNPAFIIAMATAVASTAASVAAIAGAKPPQYAIGTPLGTSSTLPGLKLVGEEGPELITTSGGERIVPAPQTAQILAAYGIPSYSTDTASLLHTQESQISTSINEDSLAKKIAQHMSKNPVATVNVDKEGITTYLATRGNKHTFLNNKFKA